MQIGWIAKLNFYSYLFSCLTHCTYFLTSTVNWCLLNVKNSLDFAFRHVSNSFTFYITVEECWSKRYVCIAYSLGNVLEWLFACWMYDYLLVECYFSISCTLCTINLKGLSYKQDKVGKCLLSLITQTISSLTNPSLTKTE